MNYFPYRTESRTTWTSTLILAVVVFVVCMAGLGTFGIYIAYAKNPKLMIGIAWLVWFFTMAAAFVMVGHYRQRVAFLEAVLFEKLGITPAALPFAVEGKLQLDERREAGEVEIIADIEAKKHMLNLPQIDYLLKQYATLSRVKNYLLNLRKEYSRTNKPHNEPLRYTDEIPSPTLEL